MKKLIADRIMNMLWECWDADSPAHKFWKRQVKKRRRSWDWWKKNAFRIERES